MVMEDRSWLDLLLPTPLGLVIYALITVFIFGAINIASIINRLFGQAVFKGLGAGDYLGLLTGLSNYPIINTIVIVIFWGGVGLIAYTIVWALINAFIEARNEIVVESEYANKGPIWPRLEVPMLKSALLALLLGWGALNKWMVAPMLVKYFGQTLTQQSGANLLLLLIPVVMGMLDLIVGVTLYKAAFNAPEVVKLAKGG